MSLTLSSHTEHALHSPPRLLPLRRLRGALPVLGLLVSLSVSLSACGTSPAGSASTPVATSTPPITATLTTTAAPSATPLLPSATKDWIPLNGQSAAAVLAAVRQSAFVQMVSSAPPSSDGYTDLSHLDAPVLVLSYGATKEGGSVNSPDYFEIPVRSSTGLVDNVISAELNRAHTAIYVGSLSGAGPMPTWPGHLVNASEGVQIVQVQRHTALRPGTNAQLIYLAAYNTSAVERGEVTWNAGGGGPQAPIWLVPGADGHDYFVAIDAQSYTLAELPLQ